MSHDIQNASPEVNLLCEPSFPQAHRKSLPKWAQLLPWLGTSTWPHTSSGLSFFKCTDCFLRATDLESFPFPVPSQKDAESLLTSTETHGCCYQNDCSSASWTTSSRMLAATKKNIDAGCSGHKRCCSISLPSVPTLSAQCPEEAAGLHSPRVPLPISSYHHSPGCWLGVTNASQRSASVSKAGSPSGLF